MSDLQARYGPWALIVGGSEGIGEHFARQLGAAGVNLVLVARKPAPLAATAAAVRDAFGVEVRTLELDIARNGAFARIEEATERLEVGLVIHNVGGGGSGLFLDKSMEEAVATVNVNAVMQTRLASRFAKAMAARGRGGLLFVGSMAGNAGGYFFSTYSASKAFTQIFAEALWAELQPQGVDVLALVIGATDTPSRRRSGVKDDGVMPVASPEAVARLGLEQLPHGPVYVAPENLAFFEAVNAMPRRQAAELMRDLLTRMSPTDKTK